MPLPTTTTELSAAIAAFLTGAPALSEADALALRARLLVAEGGIARIIVDATTARTPAPEDDGACVRLTSGSGCAITLEADAAAGWDDMPTPARLRFLVAGAPASVSAPGVTVYDPHGMLAAMEDVYAFSLLRVGADHWQVIEGV